MNIFTRIGDYLENKQVDKLKRRLLMIQKNEFEFNPFKIGMPKSLVDKSLDALELAENIVWSQSNGASIRQFYQDNVGKFYEKYDNRQTYFCYCAPETQRYIHSGLPKLISESMSSLIFGNGYKFESVVYKDNGKDVNEEASGNATLVINKVLDGANIDEKLLRSGTIESITGDVAWKLSYDFSLSHLPILEVFDRRNYDVYEERGIVKAITFKSYFEKKVNDSTREFYTFKETYTHDENGYVMILNELYQMKNGKDIQVPLNRIEETALLEPEQKLLFAGDIAWHKKNKEYAGINSNYPYGASDYSTKDNFDGLDEIVSQIVNEIRDNKPIRMWDERLLDRDENGNFKKINKFITNYVLYRGSDDQNAKPVQDTEFTDKTEEHIKKYKTMVELACSDCKISPISLGLAGDISIASGDETLKERTAISRETATKKKALWKEFLDRLLPDYIAFAKYLTTLSSYPRNPKSIAFKKLIDSVDVESLEFNTQINSFDIKSIEDKLTTWSSAKSSGISSIENVVEQVYGDVWTKDQIDTEVNRIKIENNVNLDNPELLQFNEEDEENE